MVGGVLLSVVTGCAVPRAGTAPPPPRPPVATRESLRINVVYPAATDILQSHDSAFVFGSVRGGSGPLRLTLEGRPVPVRENGAWLAWLGLPDDTLTQLRLVAHAGVDSAATLVVARIAPRFHPPPGHAAWIDTTSFTPTGSLLLPAGEGIVLSVRATPGASVQLALPGGAMIPLVPDTLPAERAWGLQAFAIDSAGYSLPPDAARYAGWLPAAPLCTDGRTGCATLDVAVAGDTTSARWPLTVALADMTLPTVVRLNHDTAHTGTTDSLTAGRAVPHGTYNWFFPMGTTAVQSGRWNDQVRLQLSRGAVAWVNTADVVPLAPGTPPPGGAGGDPPRSASRPAAIPGDGARAEPDAAVVRSGLGYQLDAVRRHGPLGHANELRAAHEGRTDDHPRAVASRVGLSRAVRRARLAARSPPPPDDRSGTAARPPHRRARSRPSATRGHGAHGIVGARRDARGRAQGQAAARARGSNRAAHAQRHRARGPVRAHAVRRTARRGCARVDSRQRPPRRRQPVHQQRDQRVLLPPAERFAGARVGPRPGRGVRRAEPRDRAG